MPDMAPELLKQQAGHPCFSLCEWYPFRPEKQGVGIVLEPEQTMLCVCRKQPHASVQHGADHGLNDAGFNVAGQASVGARVQPGHRLILASAWRKDQCQRARRRLKKGSKMLWIKTRMRIAQLQDEHIARA